MKSCVFVVFLLFTVLQLAKVVVIGQETVLVLIKLWLLTTILLVIFQLSHNVICFLCLVYEDVVGAIQSIFCLTLMVVYCQSNPVIYHQFFLLQVDIPVQGSKTNEKEEIQRDKDKTKRKKDKKEKKSKKDKKHKKKQYSDDEIKESKRRKRKHDHDELDKFDNKNAKYERKRSHNHSEHKKNSKRKRHDSSESESSDEKGKYSKKRFDPSTEGYSGKAGSKHRIDERPKERRQRHDTE